MNSSMSSACLLYTSYAIQAGREVRVMVKPEEVTEDNMILLAHLSLIHIYGTKPCKQGFLSSVLVSSFPNRKLNLRFGFFYANLQQPLSQPAAASIPTPFVPSGHFPLIGGIGPWKGSL